MKKSLIAVAVLGTAVTASAQVTLSGRGSMEVGQWEAKGATAGAASDFRGRTRVVDTASRITFAVNESLGGGMNAKIYCETGINIDNASNTGQAGTVNANTSEWCSREGHMAIGNQTMEVRLGRQNVWWTQGPLNTMGANYTGSDAMTNIINGGVGVYGVRLENMIKLVANAGTGAFAGSELYHGFMGNSGAQAAAAGAAYPTPNVLGEAAAANTSPVGKYTGFKVNYNQGAMVGMVDHQRSDNGTLERSAYKFGGGYRYAGAKSPSIVSLQYFAKESKVTATGVKSDDKGWVLVGQYAMAGGLIAHVGWAKADAVNTVANSGGSGYTLSLTKDMSNRTRLYASYHSITNQAAATYAMGGGNYQSGTPAAGADTKAFGLGVIHNF